MSLEVSLRKELGDFRLEVEFSSEGGPLGILGASGCGKSLTLKCIAGIETPDSGRIVLDGRVLFDSERGINLRPQLRKTGYLFQDYALFPNMTALQNITSVLRLPRADKTRTAREMLARFRLEGAEGLYPHMLSGGQRQRAALARMLAAGPSAVLLDEPFSALDAYLREEMLFELGELLRGLDNAVLVTHSRDEVYRLCGSLLIIDGGRVIASGATVDIFKNPRTVQAARLTGCKNIAPASRLSEYELEVPDWGLRLRTGERVGEGLSHVGVRAHDFVPLSKPEPGAVNLARIRVLELTEEPFECNIIFENADSGGTPGRLWWKCPRGAAANPPDYIHIPPKAVLPLTEDQFKGGQ